jgi:hypothetical protein
MATDKPPSAIADEDTSLSAFTMIDLSELAEHPENYDFFSFRPNLKKLMLAGATDTEHISILWYTVPGGSVGLHHHAMTEAVYTIAGTQADARGVYPTGSLYFNPPGSSHAITDSTGFFLLAYASPPDFAKADRIADYTPVQINTADPELATRYPFEPVRSGVEAYHIPLDPAGGISAQLIKSNCGVPYEYSGNYVLVLDGNCTMNGTLCNQNRLVVAPAAPQPYHLTTAPGQSWLALGLSFCPMRNPEKINGLVLGNAAV